MNLIPQTAQKDHYLMQNTFKAIIHGRLLAGHAQIITSKLTSSQIHTIKNKLQ